MMRPPRGVWCFMMRKASWVQRKGPVRLMSSTDFHCSKLSSSSGTPGELTPALLNSRSRRPNSSPYTATKHAITGLTKATALDGRNFDIACGQIDIGNAATEMAGIMARGVPQANGTIAVEPLMDVEHVASAVLYMAKLPLDANVQFMSLLPPKMPAFIGRG